MFSERLRVVAGLAHRRGLVLVTHPGTALQLAAEAAHRAGGDDRLAGAARSDHHVDAGARPGGHHGQPDVAVADDGDPRAERPDPLEQRQVAGPVEQDDGEVLHLHVHGEGDAAEVVLRRVADVDGAARLRADRDLVHVGDRRREQDAPRLGDGGDAERLAEPAGHEADPVDREHGEVDTVAPGADGSPREQPVVGALRADDDSPLEGHARQRLLHHLVAGVAGARPCHRVPASDPRTAPRPRLREATRGRGSGRGSSAPPPGRHALPCSSASSVPRYMIPTNCWPVIAGLICVTARVAGLTATTEATDPLWVAIEP